jgi:GntR family uxuAB operon transcriptional repressor
MNSNASKHKRLYQEIGHKLCKELSDGRYKVGDRLPPERDIAEKLSISRAVVREALIMLELMELVEVRKGSGVFVIKLPSEEPPTSDMTDDLDEEDVGPFEMMQARQLIESNIAEFAATQVTKNDIKRMRDALELERKSIELDVTEYDGDRMFHLAIAEATQNSVLVDVLVNLWEQREKSPMWKQLHSHITDKTYRRKWLIDHDNILAAIQRRNPDEARRAMWQHLENVKDTLMALSEHEDPDFDGYLFNKSPIKVEPS